MSTFLDNLSLENDKEFLNPKIMTSNPEIGKCWVH